MNSHLENARFVCIPGNNGGKKAAAELQPHVSPALLCKALILESTLGFHGASRTAKRFAFSERVRYNCADVIRH